MNIAKWLFLFSISLTLLSCGASKDEKRLDAILNAVYYIEQGDCEQAITILEAVGRDSENFIYVKALASAYACKAGYSTVALFADITDHFGTPSVLGGLTLFSNADIAVNPDIDESFQALQEAIDILLYAGGIGVSTEPTVLERATHFSADDAGDINAFLFYLVMEQIGKYVHYYGNSSSTGVKGSGSAVNHCFFNYKSSISGIEYDVDSDGTNEVYTIGDLLLLTNTTSSPTGACKTADNTTDPIGHPDFGVNGSVDAEQVGRLCSGVTLMNTFFDTISGVITGVSGGLGTISTTEIDAFKDFLEATSPGAGKIINQANCKSNFSADTTNLQKYFIIVFETLFQ